MSRTVIHDGQGVLQVRFPFDRSLVDRIKSLPSRRWNAAERFWSVPESDAVLLVDLLRAERFHFDEATRELYRSYGGAAEIPDAPEPPASPAAARARRPGLFDEPPLPFEPAEASGTDDDLTVSGLNQRVQQAIEGAFPGRVWIVGEVSGFNKSAHRRIVGFELAERTPDGRTVSKVPATLFESTRREIERALETRGNPFRLEDEITVRMRVRVELYIPWGQYRVVVEELDLDFTLGEAARRREEIIRRLTEQSLVGVNDALPLPPLPLRVALITSLGSDACNDVLRTLQESGFAFDVTVHGARVQGRSTEPSVLNALDRFRDRHADFDVVLICRGGGSRTDLVWFDTEPLGRAVARFPLPVIVGIGHEQDRSVLDAVARSCKTPTAAAALLVETVAERLERVEELGRSVLERSARRIADERRSSAERAARLARAARGRLTAEREGLGQRAGRAAAGSRAVLRAARERVARHVERLPRGARVLLERRAAGLGGAARALLQGARRDLAHQEGRIGGLVAALGPRSRRLLARQGEVATARERRLALVHPRRVLERGYSVLRREDGRVVRQADMAPAGERVRAETRRGILLLRSEGPEPAGGD